MLRFTLMAIGAVVASVFLYGVVKTGAGTINGTDNPANVQRNITDAFTEAGLVVPQGGGVRQPAPYGNVPQGTDRYRDLQRYGR